MKTYSLDLVFLGMPKDALPGPAISHVYVKNWTERDYKAFKGHPLITPDCVSVQELDHEIDRLHKELDIIRSTARLKYAAYERLEEQRFKAKQSGKGNSRSRRS